MAEIEVSPQEEMANLQGMKVLAVERSGLPIDFVMEILGITSQRSVAPLHEYIL